MPAIRVPCFSRHLLALLSIWIGAEPAWAELYKCERPDGRISYQQTACDGLAGSSALQVDIRGPDGTETGRSEADYSVEGQATRMRADREALTRARLKARREAEARAQALRAAARPVKRQESDRAKCAKHRGEAAKWKQEVMQGYHTRAEKERQETKLAEHQAMMELYCD